MNELLIEIAGGLLVGASLGLVGAGGAILSVPIFEVLLAHGAKDAIAEALLVTCAVACASTVRAALARAVDWHRVVLLGVPGVIGAAAGGWFAHELSDTFQLSLFAIVAMIAAWKMATPPPAAPAVPAAPTTPAGAPPADGTGAAGALANNSGVVHAPVTTRTAAVEASAVGLGIGVLTGVVGVGGGFLLVPALVLLMRVPMRVAVGTSLAVIAFNSAVGFIGNRIGDPRDVHPDWQAVAVVAACGIAGSLAGSAFAGRLPILVLRRVFAGLLVAVAVLVVVRQVVAGG